MAKTARANWLFGFNIDARGARRLEHALCALADNEGPVADALVARGHSKQALHDVCDAIRLIVDGPEDL
jgi:hypothetical protein